MRIRFGIAVVGIVALAGACGGGGIAVEDLDGEVVDSQCEFYVGCGLFASVDDCRDAFGGELGGLGDLIAGVDDGSIEYDGDAAAECLDDLANASCQEAAEENRTTNDACENAFTGTLDDGASCYIDEQCKSANCVTTSCPNQCCVGTCQPGLEEAAIGEPCGNIQCADGGYCDGSVCAELVGQGSACEFNGMCDYGLLCYAVNDGPLQCNPTPGVGDPCIAGEDCATIGLTCDTSNTTCQPFLHPGDACDPQNDLCSFFEGSCDAETMTCTAYPGVGEPCPGFFCSGGAWCDFDFETQQSECKAPLANGEACDSDIQCSSDYCDDQTMTCATPEVCVGMGGVDV